MAIGLWLVWFGVLFLVYCCGLCALGFDWLGGFDYLVWIYACFVGYARVVGFVVDLFCVGLFDLCWFWVVICVVLVGLFGFVLLCICFRVVGSCVGLRVWVVLVWLFAVWFICGFLCGCLGCGFDI